jgi:hypothetical protein
VCRSVGHCVITSDPSSDILPAITAVFFANAHVLVIERASLLIEGNMVSSSGSRSPIRTRILQSAALIVAQRTNQDLVSLRTVKVSRQSLWFFRDLTYHRDETLGPKSVEVIVRPFL